MFALGEHQTVLLAASRGNCWNTRLLVTWEDPGFHAVAQPRKDESFEVVDSPDFPSFQVIIRMKLISRSPPLHNSRSSALCSAARSSGVSPVPGSQAHPMFRRLMHD